MIYTHTVPSVTLKEAKAHWIFELSNGGDRGVECLLLGPAQ